MTGNALHIDELYKEKSILAKDFETTKNSIMKVETDLNNMKANMQAIAGAIQEVTKLINLCEAGGKKLPEKVKK